MVDSPNRHARNSGDGRQTSFSTSNFGLHDPRNPRIDTIIHSQQQPSFNSPAFDTSSPVSLDLNYPFPGSPHGSSNSGIDAPPDIRMSQSQIFPARSSLSGTSHPGAAKITSQHRASINSVNSAFDTDQEMMNLEGLPSWTPTNSGNQALSNSDDSPRKASIGENHDKKSAEDDRPPTWSELKTKAGKERKRLPLACIACRRKKIRCSGEKPACKHCLRARVPCVYKVTARKAAPRTDYMAMLDKRLKRMEDRVIRVIPKEEVPDLNVTGRSSVRPPLPGQAPKKEKAIPGAKRSAEEAFTHEMNDWTKSRQSANPLDGAPGNKNPPEGANKLFVEGAESLPPQHIQEHLAEVFFDCVYGQSYLLLHKPSFMRKLKAGTVPPVLILAVCAISARFSTHPQVSTEPAFLRGEQWATPARRIAEKRHYEPNITILNVMLMLGLHYFGTCEGGLSWSFGGQAMRMGYALQLHRELDHDPLGRNEVGKSSDPKKPNVKLPELSFTDREIRRRTMWACYLMDTFNSSGTERPSFLNEDYYQIQLPIKETHFQMEVPGPTEDLNGAVPIQKVANKISSDTTDLANEAKSNMGVAAYIVRGVVLWKRIVKYLNLGGKEKDPYPIWDSLSQFAILQRQITQLRTSLPDNITYTSENLATHISERLANQYLFLHIIIAQTSLFLHRFAIPTQPSSRPHHHSYIAAGMPKTFLTTSANAVIVAAQLISQLISDSTGHTLTVPFAGYCAYAAATVHVWGIFSKSAALEASSKENLRHNYKYLTRMKRYWGMFHYMAESVKDIYRAFADVSLKQPSLLRQISTNNPTGDNAQTSPLNLSRSGTPPTNNSNVTSGGGKTMFQYGDWFDKYPHGVSESEWESSHLEFKKEGDKGSEAVMSQRSDLQSVEEFFATLAPPSKAEDGSAGSSRLKKIPRRRGKSLADGKTATGQISSHVQQKKSGSASGISGTNARTQSPGLNSHQRQSSAAITMPAGGLSPELDMDLTQQAFTTPDFNMNSPSIYQSAQFASSQPQQALSNASDPYNMFSPSTPQFNFNYTSALPHLDRQMVFGAYAGIDPSTNTDTNSILNNLNSNFSNPWESIDMNGFGQLGGDPMGIGGGMGMNATTGSAWFMPFNIEPPTFDGTGMDAFGGNSLDVMDPGDFGTGGGGSSTRDDVFGSFSGQGSGHGQT